MDRGKSEDPVLLNTQLAEKLAESGIGDDISKVAALPYEDPVTEGLMQAVLLSLVDLFEYLDVEIGAVS
jgi:hypothetical protein